MIVLGNNTIHTIVLPFYNLLILSLRSASFQMIKKGKFHLEKASTLTHEFFFDHFNTKILQNFPFKIVIQINIQVLNLMNFKVVVHLFFL